MYFMPSHAVDGLLQRDGYRRFHGLSVRADISAGDHSPRRRQDLEIAPRGSVGMQIGAGQHDEQRANGGENRPVNEEINEQSVFPFSWSPR